MNKQIIIILLMLIAFLFIGFPMEISSLVIDRIATIFIAILISILLVKLFLLILKLKSKSQKLFFSSTTILITIIYMLIGSWTILINHNNAPIWEDTHIYTNQNGQKIISQFRETSGSIHDFRERLVLYEFGNNNRISINWKKSRMTGIWDVYNKEKNTKYQIDFDTLKTK